MCHKREIVHAGVQFGAHAIIKLNSIVDVFIGCLVVLVPLFGPYFNVWFWYVFEQLIIHTG